MRKNTGKLLRNKRETGMVEKVVRRMTGEEGGGRKVVSAKVMWRDTRSCGLAGGIFVVRG